METSRIRIQAAGAIGLALIITVVLVLLGMYQKKFTPVLHVTVQSDRAGLQLDKGARVRAFGVPVGEVREVKVDGDHVEISIALDKDSAKRIPQDVTASIRATTVFGAKFVALEVPRGTVTNAIAAESVINSDSTTIEANDVFAHAVSLLDAFDPAKLNTTLTAMSKAFDGNGENIGSLIDNTDTYLKTMNPSLDQLETDLDLTTDVGRNVNAVAPQTLKTVKQLTVTTDLFNNMRTEFRQVLKQIVPAADSVNGLFKSFDKPLTNAVDNLLTPSRTLYEYSPGLPCTLGLLVDHVGILGKALGQKHPFAQANASFLPGADPYTKANLPKLVTGVGPKCYEPGGTEANLHPPHISFDDGTKDVYDSSSGVADPDQSPFSIHQDTVKSFLGESGLNEMLKLLIAEGGTTETPGAATSEEGTN